MADFAPFADSTELVGDSKALRARLDLDGYLYVRGLIPPETIDAVRGGFTSAMAAADWFLGDPELLRADPRAFCVEPQAGFREVYHHAYRSEAFHALAHSVTGMLSTLLPTADILVHPRPIGRIVFPAGHAPDGADYTTPAHQDYVSVQGTAATYTVWAPMHDVPREQGPLAVAEGSHRAGVQRRVPAFGTGGTVVEDEAALAWRSGVLRRGDALVFHSMCVHKALPNRTDRFRISMDFRFQSSAEPVCERSLDLSTGTLNWPMLYADWRDDALKYYWRKQKLDVVPFVDRFERERDAVAFEFGERGDRRAVSTLQRIAVHDADEAMRERALVLLRRLGSTA